MKKLIAWHRAHKNAGRFALALLIANEIRGIMVVAAVGPPILKAVIGH